MALRVKAIRVGYFDHLRRRENSVFEIDVESQLGSWMQPIGWKPKGGRSKAQMEPPPIAMPIKAPKGRGNITDIPKLNSLGEEISSGGEGGDSESSDDVI